MTRGSGVAAGEPEVVEDPGANSCAPDAVACSGGACAPNAVACSGVPGGDSSDACSVRGGYLDTTVLPPSYRRTVVF